MGLGSPIGPPPGAGRTVNELSAKGLPGSEPIALATQVHRLGELKQPMCNKV